MARLKRLGSKTTADVPLTSDRVRLGRDSDNDIVIDLTEISRAHVRIERDAGLWRIVDLDSTNGTVVDLTALRAWQPSPLNDRDVIDLGGAVQFRFELDDTDRGPEPTIRRAISKTVRLTRTEAEVLELLLLHYDRGRSAPRLATVREIADERSTSTSAVKLVLAQLYNKFELFESAERNKESLAIRAQEWQATRRRS